MSEWNGVHVDVEAVVPDDVAPATLALVGLSVGRVGGTVLAGASVANSLPLLAALLAAGTVLYVVRSRE